MSKLFQHTNAYWVRYSQYEITQDADGILYVVVSENAQPAVYDPMKEETLVIDALNVGRLAMTHHGNEHGQEIREAVLGFVTKYGLLGLMQGLPTTADFMDYEAVYLLKNHFIKAEALGIDEYLSLFYPFDKPDIYKDSTKTRLDMTSYGTHDRKVLAVAMTFQKEPTAVTMGMLPIYTERYDWLVTQFRDWAFMLVSSHLFYDQKDNVDQFTLDLYKQGVAAFGSKAPTYHVELYDDKPTIVWDFYSLMLTIQTMFGFALTDEGRPVRVCKQCNKAFYAQRNNSVFCSSECKNQFNVYKNREDKE